MSSGELRAVVERGANWCDVLDHLNGAGRLRGSYRDRGAGPSSAGESRLDLRFSARTGCSAVSAKSDESEADSSDLVMKSSKT